MKSVYCLMFIDTNKSSIRRAVSPAGSTKAKYIISAINSAGFAVDVISPATTTTSKGKTKFLSKEIIKESDSLNLLYAPAICSQLSAFRFLGRIMGKLWMFSYMLKYLKPDSVLVVYHSLSYIWMVTLLKRIKKFKLILEIEEMYGDVVNDSKIVKRELEYFKMADAYMFPTMLLNKRINSFGKPSAIIYGTYQEEEVRKRVHIDDTIHVVYAGTFDPRKGGAAAAAAAAFLDENYHIHILGFGNECDKEYLFKVIDETKKKTKCGLTYDGLLSGEEYIRFIQSCDIGLSTQNPDAAFNATSFPSKVLSYMANGLRVVSVRIEAVERSAVGDLVTYYDEQTPQRIAEAIRSVDFSKAYDSRARIRELDAQFQQDIKILIEAVNEVH